MLRVHLNRKNPCQPQIIPTTIPINIPIQLPNPIPQINPEASNLLDQIPDSSTSQTDTDEYLSREEFEYLKALDIIEKDAVIDTGIHFNQSRFSDPERPHDNFNLLNNWEAIVPSPILDPRYEFIKPIMDPVKYAEMPYMPQLLANARDEITRVLKIKLNEKDQIKTALIALCYYANSKKKEDMLYRHHRSKMRPLLTENDIDEHISQSASEIDKKIEEMLNGKSGMQLIRIEKLCIEAYIL